LSFIPSILWALLILYLSTTGSVNLPSSWDDLLSWDKIGHFGVYLILVILFLEAKRWIGEIIEKKYILSVIIGSAVYGIVLEYVQYAFFPNRYFEYGDMLMNVLGSMIGYYFYLVYLKYVLKLEKATIFK